MSLWAIIPAKDPSAAKSRLATRLSPNLRRALSLRLLERTVRVVDATPEVHRWMVVSNAPEPLALARRLGGLAIHELRPDAAPDGAVATTEAMARTGHQLERRLNAALQQATAVAERSGATALLILHADLLLLTSEALSAFVGDGAAVQGGERGVTIAPDRHSQGTNALLLRPPGVIQFAFGRHSYTRHLALASEAGAATTVHNDPQFAIDLDTPEDLDLLYTLTPDLDALPEPLLPALDHTQQRGTATRETEYTFLVAGGRSISGGQP
jgi:2-phospho-L-lactate guanylyltransferase